MLTQGQADAFLFVFLCTAFVTAVWISNAIEKRRK